MYPTSCSFCHTHPKPIEASLCWFTAPGYEDFSVLWLTISCQLIEETWPSLSQKQSNTFNDSAGDGIPAYFSFSKLGSRLAWLIQALWHAVCHSCIKFVWAPALLCLENTVFLKSSTTSGSHNFIYFQVDLWAHEYQKNSTTEVKPDFLGHSWLVSWGWNITSD